MRNTMLKRYVSSEIKAVLYPRRTGMQVRENAVISPEDCAALHPRLFLQC